MNKIKYNDVPFVPSNDCAHYEECREDAYQQGRLDALEEFREKINEYLDESTDFADFVVTDSAIDYVLEEMKGGAK